MCNVARQEQCPFRVHACLSYGKTALFVSELKSLGHVHSYGAQHDLLRGMMVLLMNSNADATVKGAYDSFCTSELMHLWKSC